MTKDEKVAAIKEALTNASANGYPQEPQDDATIAIDLWMDSTCERISPDERLKIVRELRESGFLSGL
jgi:hypothetical protein